MKAFNHLPAEALADESTTHGRRWVVFVSSDAAAASAQMARLVDRPGFAPAELEMLGEGRMLVQAKGRTWGQLIFQDSIEFDMAWRCRALRGAQNCS